MATSIKNELHITYGNAKTYLIADTLELADGNDNAFRLYMDSGTTGYATLNAEAMAALYPSAAARPYQADSVMAGSRGSGAMHAALQFDGTAVQDESFTSTISQTKTKNGIIDTSVTDSTRSSTVRWQIRGSSKVVAYRMHNVTLTLYFWQYACVARKAGNGVVSASVSDAAPYQGDSVTFTAELVTGAEWHGWYSDGACTQLVSTDQNYTCAPSSDMTLYAHATSTEQLYTASVGPSEHVQASAQPNIGIYGTEIVFSATSIDLGYQFDGWYADSNYTTLVSTENSYTTTMTNNLTLYPKVSIIVFEVGVGTAEFAQTSVTPNRVEYGGTATFEATIIDRDYRLDGWYTDLGCTQLVSTDNPYIHTITDNTILYPKVVLKTFTVYLDKAGNDNNIMAGAISKIYAVSVNYDAMSESDLNHFNLGEFDKISSNVVYGLFSKTNSLSSGMPSGSLTNIPIHSTVGILGVLKDSYEKNAESSTHPMGYRVRWSASFDNNSNNDGRVNYTFMDNDDKPTKVFPDHKNNVLVIKDISRDYNYYYNYGARHQNVANQTTGIAFTTVSPEYATMADHSMFTANIEDGYTFDGWYTDENCTQLLSRDNPYDAYPDSVTLETTTENNSTVYRWYYRLWAKSTLSSGGTGLYLRADGKYLEVQAVYRKVNGVYEWVDNVGEAMNAEMKYVKGN